MDSLNESFSKLDVTVDDGPTEDRCPVKVNSLSSSALGSYKVPKTLRKANLALLESKRYTDVTFIVGWLRVRFPCHKSILIARSSEFARLFGPREHGGKELKEFDIPDTTHFTFELFLKFIYTDSLGEISTMQAIELLYLACKFKVELLEDHCVMHLVENVKLSDAPQVFEAAQRTRLTDVRDFASDIMAKEFDALLSSTEFLCLEEEMQETILKLLLVRDDLPGSEMDIFNHVIRWGKSELLDGNVKNEKLKIKLASVLPLIRFPTMTIFEFANSVVPMNVLNQDIVLNILTYLAATGSVRAEYAKKLKDLHYSTTPRHLTISTASVTKSVRFHCGTPRITKPYTRELGPLLEKLRFRVEIKSVTGSAMKRDRLLLTRIILKFPKVVSAQTETPIAEQTEDNNIQVEQEKLLKLFTPAVELSDGLEYSIDVQEASGSILPYTCSPCGVLKSLVWFKASESIVKLRDIHYDSQISRDLGAGIIYGLQLQLKQPSSEKFTIDATAFREQLNFQFSCSQTSSVLTKSTPACKTSTSESPASMATPSFKPQTSTTASIFEPPAGKTTFSFKLPSCTTTSTLTLPTGTATPHLMPLASRTLFSFAPPPNTTTSTLSSPAGTTTSHSTPPASRALISFALPSSTTTSTLTPPTGTATSHSTPLASAATLSFALPFSTTTPTLTPPAGTTTSTLTPSASTTTSAFGSPVCTAISPFGSPTTTSSTTSPVGSTKSMNDEPKN